MFKINRNNIIIIIVIIFAVYVIQKKSRKEHFDSRPLNLPPTQPNQLSVSSCVRDCQQSHKSYPNGQPSCRIICPGKVARYYNENITQYN